MRVATDKMINKKIEMRQWNETKQAHQGRNALLLHGITIPKRTEN
jgi:hypothetical protein